jgi:hypothetical protein
MPRRVLGDVLFGERQNELHWETVVKSRASQSVAEPDQYQRPGRAGAILTICSGSASSIFGFRIPVRSVEQPWKRLQGSSRDLHALLFITEIGTGAVARRWRPCMSGCPSAVSHWQGPLQRAVYLSLHAHYFLTIRNVALRRTVVWPRAVSCISHTCLTAALTSAS